MQSFATFIQDHFFYVWILMVTIIFSILFIRGRAVMRMFDSLDKSGKILFTQKNASGYSLSSYNGGANKVLHVIITEKELITKSSLFFAYVMKKCNLLHIIPMESITQTELSKRRFSSQLHVKFRNKHNKPEEIVLISKNNETIQKLLNQHIR